jgi:AraC-like DNA-binding protein
MLPARANASAPQNRTPRDASQRLRTASRRSAPLAGATSPPLFDDLFGRRGVRAWESPRQVLYQRGLVTIGTFRARPDHPHFADSGPTLLPVFVFPRTTVRIEHAGRRSFVADPNVTTFYNPGQLYRRTAVDPAGDLCEWFSVRSDVAAAVISELDPSVIARPDQPFSFSHGPCDADSYLRQRALVRRIVAGETVDPLVVDETATLLLHRLAAAALGQRMTERPLSPAYRDLAERLKTLLGTRFHEDLGLGELGAALGCSPFYLARVFRSVAHTSIHQYRLALRLTRSLEHVASGRDLRVVATEVGFASHSNFSVAFHRTFGMPPSQFRRNASTKLLSVLARGVQPGVARKARRAP